MFDRLKWYLIEIGLKKYGPVGLMTLIGMLGTFMAAHAGILEQWGITYGTWPLTWTSGNQPSGPVILVELSTVSQSTIAIAASLVAIAVRAVQHHTTGATARPGGVRAGDPPAPSA